MFNQDLDFKAGCRDTGAEIKEKLSNHSLKAKKKKKRIKGCWVEVWRTFMRAICKLEINYDRGFFVCESLSTLQRLKDTSD